jgi:hypothetical protein
VANPVSHLTTANKVVWGRTSIEVNLLSRILRRISLAEPKVKSKKMRPTDPVKVEEKAEPEVEAEPRSEKEEENLGKASPKDISDTHLLPCSAAILDDLPDKMGDLGVPMSYPVFMPKPSTHRMQDPGSTVPHIRPKVFTDNQMSRINYIYYIDNVSKD